MRLPSPALQTKTIVVVDVADFTNPARTVAQQLAVHEGLYEVLEGAFKEADIDWDACTISDRGDGAMILIPPEVTKSLLADRLPNRLLSGLRRYNHLHADLAAVQLRVGFHFGEVHESGFGVVSQAVNHAFRILDASAAKSALRVSSGGVVALIASDSFYRQVIAQDPAAEPDSYRHIPVNVKTTSAEAWLRLLPDGIPIEPEIPEKAHGAGVGADLTPGPALDLLPAEELERLSGLISDLTVPNLPTVVARVAGPATPIPRTDNAWQVFLELTDRNAGPDGIPPAIKFLDLLATQVATERIELSKWITRYAGKLRIESVLADHRAATSAIPAEPRLHLLIAVEPGPPGGARYEVSFWRQDDPEQWPPARGDIEVVTLDDLEQRVDQVVLAAERAWAGHSAKVTLEFLLPRALLGLPVHRWGKELESGNPRPLTLDYPVILRSLERMKALHWHRVWHARWSSLQEDPSATRIHFGVPADTQVPHRVDAVLGAPRWVSMVLAEAPPAEPQPGAGLDELTAALRRGLPILIWHPQGAPEAVREIVKWLTRDAGLVELPARSQESRLAEFLPLSAPFNINIARDLVVLWDDPTRVVAL